MFLAVAASAACAPKLDTTREPADTGSFGTTVFTLACQRIAFDRDLTDGDDTVDVAGSIFRATCRQGDSPPAGAPPAIEAMHAERGSIIAALDLMFPSDYLAELQAYLTSNAFLTIYDDGTMEKALGTLVEMLDHLAEDPGLAPALARLDRRPGYRPLLPALGLVRAVAAYDDLNLLVKELTDAIAKGGPAHREFTNFQLALAKELGDAQAVPDADAPDRTLRLATALLLTESPLLGNGVTRPLVLRDARGLAIVEADPGTGDIAAPFVDVDQDGSADTNADGRFVDAAGLPIEVPTPFATPYSAPDLAAARDADGRALQFAEGPTLYRYVDLDRTVLGALVRDVPSLMDPQRGTALDFLRGASALMSSNPRVSAAVHTYSDGSTIEYRGYDTSASPLLDIAYGVLTLAADPNLPDTLAFSRALFVDHESEAARLLEAVWDIADLGDQFPDAKLEPGSAMYDDLMPIVLAILNEPGLAEDLLRGMENPKVRDLGDRFRNFMKYKDQFTLGTTAPYPVIGTFATEPDRKAADSAFNRSLFQRLLHLIHDSRGVGMCNKQGAVVKDPFIGITLATYDECEMLSVPDLAIIYVQSIARARVNGNFVCEKGTLSCPNGQSSCVCNGGYFRPKATLTFNFNNALIEGIANDDFIEEQSKIVGFRRHPTAAALNRVLLVRPEHQADLLKNSMNPAVDVDGDRFIDAHNGTLPVWEVDGFYDQMQPIVQAFADRGREDLFVDALVVLHRHWPTHDSTDTQNGDPSGHGFAKESSANRFEPMLVKVLEETDFWHALVDVSPVLNNIVVNGKNGRQVLANAGRYIFNPQPGLTSRMGATSTTTEEGVPVTTLSPWYVLADAYKGKRGVIESSASEGEAWERSTSQMVDVFLRGEDAGGTWRFKNPRVRGVSVALVDFVSGRVSAHRQAGDLVEWSRTELPGDLRDALSGPVFAGAADFVLSLVVTPGARAALEDLNAYLTSEAGAPEAFVTALTGAGDLVQLLLDDENLVPILRVVGQVLHPDFGKDLHPEYGFVDAQIEFLRAARAADETSALAKLLGFAFAELPGGERTAVGQLVDSIGEVQREHPIADLGLPLSAADYVSTFRAVAEFLGEERRGFLKFVKIVKERNVRD